LFMSDGKPSGHTRLQPNTCNLVHRFIKWSKPGKLSSPPRLKVGIQVQVQVPKLLYTCPSPVGCGFAYTWLQHPHARSWHGSMITWCTARMPATAYRSPPERSRCVVSPLPSGHLLVWWLPGLCHTASLAATCHLPHWLPPACWLHSLADCRAKANNVHNTPCGTLYPHDAAAG